ncbi:hypothetical protein MTO96_006975 [Rhipicephalus appendiculatus]
MPKMPMFENRPPMNVVPTASFTMAGQHPGLRGMRPPPPYAGGTAAMPGVRMMAHSMPGAAMSHLRGSLAGMRPPVTGVPIPGPAMGGGLSGPSGDHRPLLLQEQPLLLEDLVEQEKREQRKQSGEAATASLLSDVDFERLKADVLSGPPDDSIGAPAPVMPQATLLPAMPQQHPGKPGQLVGNPGQRYHPMQGGPAGWPAGGMVAGAAQAGGPHLMRQLPVGPGGPMVPPDQLGHVGTHAGVAGGGGALVSPGDGGATQVPFQIQTLPAPPTPSLCIGQDPPSGAMVAAYEQWLAQQDALLNSQKKTLEGEVGKLRKAKKALSTKQRQLAKTGQELPQQNALELQRIAQQQPGMQKNLDQLRKLCRQHGMVMQEYRAKQQKWQQHMQQQQMQQQQQQMQQQQQQQQGGQLLQGAIMQQGSPMHHMGAGPPHGIQRWAHHGAQHVSQHVAGHVARDVVCHESHGVWHLTPACSICVHWGWGHGLRSPTVPHATTFFPNGRPLPVPEDAAATNVPYGLSPPPDVTTVAFPSHPKATQCPPPCHRMSLACWEMVSSCEKHEGQQVVLHPRFPGNLPIPRYLSRQGGDPVSQHPPGHPYLQRTGGVHPMMRPPPPYPDHLRKPPPSPAISPSHGGIQPESSGSPDPSRTPPITVASQLTASPSVARPTIITHGAPFLTWDTIQLIQSASTLTSSTSTRAGRWKRRRRAVCRKPIRPTIESFQDSLGVSKPPDRRRASFHRRAVTRKRPMSSAPDTTPRSSESPQYVATSVYQGVVASPVGSPVSSTFAGQGQTMTLTDTFASDSSDGSSPMQVRAQMVRVSQVTSYGAEHLPTSVFVSLDYPSSTITSPDGCVSSEVLLSLGDGSPDVAALAASEDEDASVEQSRVALVVVGEEGEEDGTEDHGITQQEEPLDVAVVVETGGIDMAISGCGDLHHRSTPAGDHNYSNLPPEGADSELAKKISEGAHFFDHMNMGMDVKIEDRIIRIADEKPCIEKNYERKDYATTGGENTISTPCASLHQCHVLPGISDAYVKLHFATDRYASDSAATSRRRTACGASCKDGGARSSSALAVSPTGQLRTLDREDGANATCRCYHTPSGSPHAPSAPRRHHRR